MLDHRLKIPVVVQQMVAVLDAVGGDEQVETCPQGHAQAAQMPIIAGGRLRDVRADEADDRKAHQILIQACGLLGDRAPIKTSIRIRSPRNSVRAVWTDLSFWTLGVAISRS